MILSDSIGFSFCPYRRRSPSREASSCLQGLSNNMSPTQVVVRTRKRCVFLDPSYFFDKFNSTNSTTLELIVNCRILNNRNAEAFLYVHIWKISPGGEKQPFFSGWIHERVYEKEAISGGYPIIITLYSLRCRAARRQDYWSAQKVKKFEIIVGPGPGTLMKPKYHYTQCVLGYQNPFLDKN